MPDARDEWTNGCLVCWARVRGALRWGPALVIAGSLWRWAQHGTKEAFRLRDEHCHVPEPVGS